MRDIYYEAVCKERSWEQQRRSQHMKPNEAGWAPLEGRSSDGVLCRWCGQAVLRVERCLLALGSHVQAAATSGARLAWRPAGSMHKRDA